MGRVDLYVKNSMWTVGEDDFLHSFFSTIAYQLEREGWGSRFPALMNELHGGRLAGDRVEQALDELATIRIELEQLPPDARVYDYDDPNKPTPWPLPPDARTLADCFLTANADNLLEMLDEVLSAAQEIGADVEIRPLAGAGTHSYHVTGQG